MVDRYEGVVAAALEGAQWAWRELYLWLSPRLLAYIRARGSAEPEDALGEVWVQLVRNAGSFDGTPDGFKSWAFTVAHHRVIDEARARSRRAPRIAVEWAWPGDSEPARATAESEDEALSGLELDDLVRLLDMLTPTQQSTILLRVIADISVKDTATVLGISETAVKSAQYRGLARLREKLTATKPRPASVTEVT